MASRFVLVLFALPLLAADLRIGVLSLFRPQRISVRSSDVLQVHAASRQFFLTPGSVMGLRAVNAEIDLFANREQTPATRVTVSGRGGAPVNFSLSIEGKMNRSFTGRLEVTAAGSQLEPVILVDLESAVGAAVAAEMPREAPVEALKAMAVLARSYYTASARRHGPYDFCDTTHCQWRRESIPETSPAAEATSATKGIVVLYQGRPLAAMYHSSCGGKTRSAAQVGLSPDPYPYFPVACDACQRESPEWTGRLPADLARPLLAGFSEALRLSITRRLGWSALPGNNFSARLEGSEIVVTGRGEGHGVGVCQRGITGLARSGVDFRALLTRYLPQTRTGGLDEIRPAK
jgi:stage II sporulation protein D